MKKEFGTVRVGAWCKENNLVEALGPVKNESSELKSPVITDDQLKQPFIPSKHKQNPPNPTPSQPSLQPKKKFVKNSFTNVWFSSNFVEDVKKNFFEFL